MNGGVNGTMGESSEAQASEPSHDQISASPKDGEISKCSENVSDSDKNGNIENKCTEFEDNKDKGCGDSNLDEGNSKVSEGTDENNSKNEIKHDLSKNIKANSDTETKSEAKSKAEEKSEAIEKPNVHNSHEKDLVKKSPDKAKPIETHNIESGESSEEDGSVISASNKPEDTVSINSDSDLEDMSHSTQKGNKSNDIIIVENDNGPHSINGDSRDSSPDVHYIGSETEDGVDSKPEKPIEPRRSSRAIKRKSYIEDIENGDGDDDESEIEEVEMEDPLAKGPILIQNARSLVDMTSKKIKPNKKELSVAFTGSNSSKGQTSQGKSSNVKDLYQSIAARGTTVTPVPAKTSTAVQASPQPPTPAILPSLTDDMFVVEAPSFIVPYVYEKPSLKPFREFVEKFGKEIEEQRQKEEKERLEKEKEEKEKREKDRQGRKERGEEVSASEDESANNNAAEEKKKKKEARKERRRRRNEEEDDASWDGEASSESEEDDETLSDNDIEIIKDDSIEEIKEPTDLTTNKVSPSKSDNYFDCSLGKFFMNIGLNLVQEHVQTDLYKQQNRKLTREKKSGHSTKQTQSAIASLMKNLEFSKEINAPYAFTLKKCEFCSFKTESDLVLKHHLETPHMKNNLYKCNFCELEMKNPHDILVHMDLVHRVRGKLERAPSQHQCCNCPFEDNGKVKLARHQIACAKKFRPEQNLAPPIEWEPPAKIPKITRARNNVTIQNAFTRQVNNMVRTPMNIANYVMGGTPATMGGYRARGRAPLTPPRAAHGASIMRGLSAAAARNAGPASIVPNHLLLAAKAKVGHQPSLSITPLPRQPPPVLPSPQAKNTFVICEICDGYIKDLEQLRNHMQWIHKVKIHPKMIYNRPPLNCQKCQFRFFTDQGLERHLLGSHGLVTSSMQEAANKGKDAGRCPVCGRVYQWKLLNHVSRDHNLTLKPAHLSYKCTVCTATFGMYKQFEAHVYSAHSVVAKNVMDKLKPPPAAKGAAALKPLKINDEITIIPQPAKTATATKTK